MGWLSGREMNQYCRGRLSIANRRLVFVADKGEKAAQHSFELDPEKLKSISLNEDDRRGTFQLKTVAGGYYMATRNRNRDEARMIVELVHRELGVK
jgi:hypothetical protein